MLHFLRINFLGVYDMPTIAVKNNDATQLNEPLQITKPTVTRKTYIEVMRIIAAFLVIVNHTNSDIFMKYSEGESFTWFFSLSYFFVSKIAVPVFLMIMGGLLLQKIDPPKKSIERVLRMAVVLFVASAVYYLYINRNFPENLTIGRFLETIFTKRSSNALWYLYTYIGLMILLPLLQRMAKAFSRRAIEYLLFISVGVMGFLPLVEIFFDFKLNPYFTETFFVPLLGIVFAGFYVERYLEINKKVFAFSCATFVFIISLEVLYTQKLYAESPTSYLKLDNRENLFILSSAICFYIIFKYLSTVVKIKESVKKVLCYVGSLTFPIYLLSDLAISLTKPYYRNLVVNSEYIILITIGWEILIFVSCAIIGAILKLIPGIKKFL